MLRKALSYRYDVPWCVPPWGGPELRATVGSVLRGAVIDGDAPTAFAQAVAARTHSAYGLPFGLGRDAIAAGLRAIGVRPGSEVIMPSYVCWSLVEGVLRSGAKPRFVDIGPGLNVTPESIEPALGPSTAAVIVPHLFGNPAEIAACESMMRSRGVPLVDDAAQALGGSQDGRPLGSFGDFGIVSCGPGKPLSGTGGAVLITDDANLVARILDVPAATEDARAAFRRVLQFWLWRRGRRHLLPLELGLSRLGIVAGFDAPSSICGLSNLEAEIALCQLSVLERNREIRRNAARVLLDALGPLAAFCVTELGSTAAVMKLVLVLPQAGPCADDVIAMFHRAGVEAQGGYQPCHHRLGVPAHLPTTEAIWTRVVCVPLERALMRPECLAREALRLLDGRARTGATMS